MAPPPTFKPLTARLAGPGGCDYMLSRNMLFVVVQHTGELSFIDMSARPPAYETVLNSLEDPMDVVLSADGRHAYITEHRGTLLRAIAYPPTPRPGPPSVVSDGMNGPQQIALDEDRGHAYVVESGEGRLLRIDLQSGEQTALVSNLEYPLGLLVTKDLRFAYVSQWDSRMGAESGQVSRIELNTGRREVLVTGLTVPNYLTWADAGEGAIFITERAPADQVSLIDLTQTPVSVSPVATGVPTMPRSVAVIAPNHLVLCSRDEVSELDLTETVYTAAGPILLGIGHVPVDRIVNGYADTTRDPITGNPEDYFFSVKDAPFGGTLPLMFNHERALDVGARYYQVLVDKEEQRQSWSDYWWNASEGRFELRTTSPEHDAYYPVHPPVELWYHPWLGYMLNTSRLSNEEHMISVRLFADPDPGSEIGSHDDPGRFVVVQIDNRWPTAAIDQIIHHHEEPDGTVAPVVVDTCAIVEEETDEFTFRITAYDQEGHLKSWHLEALWGDNQSDEVASGSYAPTPSRQWPGIYDEEVPSSPWHATVTGDPTSRRCAHTFYLRVWDRVINGWGHLHGSRYHKSITIMLPPI